MASDSLGPLNGIAHRNRMEVGGGGGGSRAPHIVSKYSVQTATKVAGASFSQMEVKPWMSANMMLRVSPSGCGLGPHASSKRKMVQRTAVNLISSRKSNTKEVLGMEGGLDDGLGGGGF